MRGRAILLVLASLGTSAPSVLARASGTPRSLGLAERIAAQRAIEEVYWSHRLWPRENPAPKPPLASVMSEAALRARVEDYVGKSHALESMWRRPITAQQLQAEIRRMAASSRDPEVLRELFAALGNDPYLIAETLARQTLADRQIRDWYAFDGRIHGDLERRARAALARCGRPECMKVLGGRYHVAAARLTTDALAEPPGDGAAVLMPEEWSRYVERLTRKVGGRPGETLAGRMSGIEETATAFVVTGVLRHDERRIETAIAIWDKVPFDDWWRIAARRWDGPLVEPRGLYEIAVTAGACTPDTWSPVANPSEPRSRHVAVWTGSEMLLWGGVDENFEELATGGRYAPATDTWTPIGGSGAPAGGLGSVGVWTGSELIAFGENATAAGRYSPSSNSWQPTSPAPGLVGREGASVVWTGSEMIVWGGDFPVVNTGLRYRPSADIWAPTSTEDAPAPRASHTAVWTGSAMIVWGGSSEAGNLDTGARYDPAADAWAPIGVPGPSARSGHTAVWTGSEMIVWGGGPDETGGRYDPASDLWLPTSTTGAAGARSGHTAVWTGSEMIVWGGAFDGSGGRYDPVSDTWSPTTTVSAPDDQRGHSAVWTGTEMIVWGGSAFSGRGARYAPSMDTWVATGVSGAPSGRIDHTAIWTGTEMIVWGGWDWASLTPDTGVGGRYVPALDAWAPTATAAAPEPRNLHTAVWTGRAMVVWGGRDAAGQGLSSGGRYDPAADAWTPTAAAGAPAARYDHTAIWTGATMVVWGGFGDFGTFATGGIYDPAEDAWHVVAESGAPAPRQFHAAVWTGAEMIVWGGGGLPLSSGGRYDLASDAWSATTENGAPVPRLFPESVWTGTELIVWGGYNIDFFDPARGCLNTGGRYEPASDAWAPTTTVNAPGHRFDHTAVWTGAEMIVWGGFVDGPHYGDGARYAPAQDAWVAMSAQGAPSPRRGHTAVWTGRGMIVWGGNEEQRFPASGGFYCACPAGALVYRDHDGDGFGIPSPTSSCDGSAPPGYALNGLDCDDADPATHPGAAQACDGIANDCDDPAWPAAPASERDGDLDGYRICGGDCNDDDPSIAPGSVERCNALDDDCDGQADEDPLGVDSDGDGVRNACDNCRAVTNPTQLDTDEDAVGDACDNCVVVTNPDQRDGDADLRGDLCDNCPATYNPLQGDQDGDVVGNPCDNCRFDANGTQSDFDHDGQGDRCDLDDGLIYLFSDDVNAIEWAPESGPTRWNVYEGDLAVLKATGVYTQRPGSNALADRHCNKPFPSVSDFDVPAPRRVKFSLVTGVRHGVEGSLGTTSSGTPRPNTDPCP